MPAWRSALISALVMRLPRVSASSLPGDGHVLAGTPVHGTVVDGPEDPIALQVQGVDRVERAQHLVGVAQAEGPQEHRAEELALAVDAHVQQVLAVVLELDPRAAIRDELPDEERLVFRVEEGARRPVQLRHDDALGAVDDERPVIGHQRDVAEVDLLLLDVADGLGARLGVLVPDHQADRHLERDRIRHPALEALVDVVLEVERHAAPTDLVDQATSLVTPSALVPVADRVLDELQRGVLAEVRDREDRLEDGLQADVLALGRQRVHLQEAVVGLLLDLDQVGNRDGRPDLGKVDALAVDVLGQAAAHTSRFPRVRFRHEPPVARGLRSRIIQTAKAARP